MPANEGMVTNPSSAAYGASFPRGGSLGESKPSPYGWEWRKSIYNLERLKI